jgi:hypothetical protein
MLFMSAWGVVAASAVAARARMAKNFMVVVVVVVWLGV